MFEAKFLAIRYCFHALVELVSDFLAFESRLSIIFN
jgi:hypothetical protein